MTAAQRSGNIVWTVYIAFLNWRFFSLMTAQLQVYNWHIDHLVPMWLFYVEVAGSIIMLLALYLTPFFFAKHRNLIVTIAGILFLPFGLPIIIAIWMEEFLFATRKIRYGRIVEPKVFLVLIPTVIVYALFISIPSLRAPYSAIYSRQENKYTVSQAVMDSQNLPIGIAGEVILYTDQDEDLFLEIDLTLTHTSSSLDHVELWMNGEKVCDSSVSGTSTQEFSCSLAGTNIPEYADAISLEVVVGDETTALNAMFHPILLTQSMEYSLFLPWPKDDSE